MQWQATVLYLDYSQAEELSLQKTHWVVCCPWKLKILLCSASVPQTSREIHMHLHPDIHCNTSPLLITSKYFSTPTFLLTFWIGTYSSLHATKNFFYLELLLKNKFCMSQLRFLLFMYFLNFFSQVPSQVLSLTKYRIIYSISVVLSLRFEVIQPIR